VITDVRQLFEYPFMVNAFRAGTIVAVVAGVVGWFMVLRRQSFAGHTLAVVGFPGAAGAVLLGVSATLGYFAFPTRGSRRFDQESAVIGTVQVFALACGFLFVSLYAGNLGSVSSLLFGSFLGITESQVAVLAVGAVVAMTAFAMLARPLLFASIDADVAAARGLPVRLLSTAFLVLLGLAAAETSQITGSLLVFALLVLPPATAQAVSVRPGRSVVLGVVIGVAVTWVGLGIAYYTDQPIGFWITSLAFGLYVVARIVQAARATVGRRAPRVVAA
jgi:zinc/manganese transport system permease protein